MRHHSLAKIIFTIGAASAVIFVVLVWYASRSVEQKANSGDTEAQYLLALKLIDQSRHDKAMIWIQKAAEEGHTPAQVILGNFHLEGNATPKDPVRARHWFEQAAKDDHPTALYNLGLIYLTGAGLPLDKDRAMFYFEKASEEGHLAGKLKVAELLMANGIDSKRDGIAIYRSLADSGQVPAKVALARYYAESKQHKNACDWYESAAEQNHAESKFKLAMCYHDGLGREKDLSQFFAYVSEAASLGLPEAQLATGDAYAMGLGAESEITLAKDWYQKAADQNLAKAQYKLAKILVSEDNDSAAEKYLTKSAAQDYAPAQYELGELLLRQDEDTAMERACVLFEKAARSGHTQAQYQLGALYAEGKGVAEDAQQALMWYTKAAQAGHTQAAKAMKSLSSKTAMPAH